MVSRRVLLVDEVGPAREAMARMLSGEGHEVRVADASDARDLIEGFCPDTIVYGADRESEALRRVVTEIEESPPAQRLVALGAEISRAAGDRSAAASRCVAIARPVNLEELRRRLRED